MASSAIDIRKYDFSETDGLLFDANIWLLLYGPAEPNSNRVRIYSEAFIGILNARSPINLEVLILSEFVNRFARFEYELARDRDHTLPMNFKDFRNTPTFVPIALSISVAAKKIARYCHRVDTGFPELEIDSLLDEYAGGATDFNDQALARLCQLRGYKLITDDSDFKVPGITIITANRKLLT